MTTTSEKILSEMERMGRMKIKDLCAQIGWQYQKFHRRIDRAVSRYWQHPFRRGHDGSDHPIDPKTGDYTDGYHE